MIILLSVKVESKSFEFVFSEFSRTRRAITRENRAKFFIGIIERILESSVTVISMNYSRIRGYISGVIEPGFDVIRASMILTDCLKYNYSRR